MPASPVKQKQKIEFHRFLTSPLGEQSFIKRIHRFTTPTINENLTRKFTPKEFIRRKSNLRPKTTSYEKLTT